MDPLMLLGMNDFLWSIVDAFFEIVGIFLVFWPITIFMICPTIFLLGILYGGINIENEYRLFVWLFFFVFFIIMLIISWNVWWVARGHDQMREDVYGVETTQVVENYGKVSEDY